jgi:PhnB protein
MASRLNPYISFNGDAREAMEFYKSVFGGKLEFSEFKDTPMPGQDAADDHKIMHALLETDNGMVLMAADTPKGMEYKPAAGISISVSGDDDAELSGYWDKLAEGGNVTLPLETAPWGDKFGMLIDKFGIQWMVNIAGKKQ